MQCDSYQEANLLPKQMTNSFTNELGIYIVVLRSFSLIHSHWTTSACLPPAKICVAKQWKERQSIAMDKPQNALAMVEWCVWKTLFITAVTACHRKIFGCELGFVFMLTHHGHLSEKASQSRISSRLRSELCLNPRSTSYVFMFQVERNRSTSCKTFRTL